MDVRSALEDVTNVDNYRILLALALDVTRGSAHAVLEMGTAGGATLHDWCVSSGRRLVTVEEDIMACVIARKFESVRHEIMCCAWSAAPIEARLWSVALIDHAPGERRWADVMRLKDRCEIIVIHDTEPAAEHGYGFERNGVWDAFKNRVDIKSDGAWATAVSNSRDLSKWRGLRFGRYVVTGAEDDRKEDATFEHIRKYVEGQIDPEAT